MKPRPAVIPVWNEFVASSSGRRRPRPARQPAEDHVPVAQPDHVDADRLGRLRVLADGPRPQAPARPEQQDLEDDDDDDDATS